MPVGAGNRLYASDIPMENYPLVRLAQAVAQSMPDNVITAVTFTTEDLDTHGFHDPVTNNSRITPNIPGWYRFTGTVFFATPTTPVVIAAFLRKNAAVNVSPGDRRQTAVLNPNASCTALISCNGTTDYVELCGLQDSAAAVNTVISAYIGTVLECEFLRPL